MQKIFTSALWLSCLLAPAMTAHAGAVVGGEETAAYLQLRHYLRTYDCGVAVPAFACSGVIMRGAAYSSTSDAWEADASSDAVSFMYLRVDAESALLDSNSGFIFHAPNDLPPARVSVDVLCAFPIKADSGQRDYRGCGSHSSFPTESKPCDKQNIHTALSWQEHYVKNPQDIEAYQCGFDLMQISQTDVTARFKEFTIARQQNFDASEANNELRLAAWPAGNPEQLPIEAFFYSPANPATGKPSGLADAQNIQRSFHEKTGLAVPLIKYEPPQPEGGVSIYSYQEEDQAI
jgi:hypothetical protein